jgi:hypothetical protein
MCLCGAMRHTVSASRHVHLNCLSHCNRACRHLNVTHWDTRPIGTRLEHYVACGMNAYTVRSAPDEKLASDWAGRRANNPPKPGYARHLGGLLLGLDIFAMRNPAHRHIGRARMSVSGMASKNSVTDRNNNPCQVSHTSGDRHCGCRLRAKLGFL